MAQGVRRHALRVGLPHQAPPTSGHAAEGALAAPGRRKDMVADPLEAREEGERRLAERPRRGALFRVGKTQAARRLIDLRPPQLHDLAETGPGERQEAYDRSE